MNARTHYETLAKQAAASEWIKYSEQKPTNEGPYEWRVPSTAVPGLIVTCVAHMRKRGAGYTEVISPVFDYWDGYRVHVPDGTEWREVSDIKKTQWHEITSIAAEGVVNVPCPFCGMEPSWEAHIASMSGGYVIGSDPHRLNEWKLNCCTWAKTPRFRDPRELSEKRNAMLAARTGASA